MEDSKQEDSCISGQEYGAEPKELISLSSVTLRDYALPRPGALSMVSATCQHVTVRWERASDHHPVQAT